MSIPSTIPGQDHIKNHFKNAVASHKISHAYILSGERGTGRSDSIFKMIF